jgi:hypothetical protein
MTNENKLEYGHQVDIPIEAYHADSEWITSTKLKRFAESPALYNVKEQIAESASIRIGKAVHAYALNDQDEIDSIRIFDDRRSKAYKDFAKTEEATTALILNRKEYDIANHCADALYEDDVTCNLLDSGGFAESVLCWTDHLAMKCKARPDLLNRNAKLVCDIKTIANFSLRDIYRSFEKFRYHLQASHYLAGCRTIFGTDSDWQFVFCFVETKAPFRTTAISLSDYSLSRSDDFRFELLERIRVAEKLGKFEDSLANSLTQIDLPERCYE